MSNPSVTHVRSSHKSPSLLDYLDRPIAFHRIFVTLTGSVTAAIMLSQALYWSKRTRGPEGWFWKTREEWEEETGLSRTEQEGARKRLRDHPGKFWHEQRRGLPAKLYFHIDPQNLEQAILQLPLPDPLPVKKSQQNPQNAENPPTRWQEPDHLEGGKAADQMAENLPTITETTAETTLEISPEITNNVGTNVGVDHEPGKRRIRLTPRQEDLVDELETQFDTHSRGAFCVLVSDHGLGDAIASRLLRETLEAEENGRIRTTPVQYFIDLCIREAERQGIDLGFKRPGT